MVGLSENHNANLRFENKSDLLQANVTTEGSQNFMGRKVYMMGRFFTNTVSESTVDYKLQKEIEYYEVLEDNIWKILSPLLLGKGCWN